MRRFVATLEVAFGVEVVAEAAALVATEGAAVAVE